ncbi:hypothetical protein DIPPA_30999 [Diplonema papillatum]|nr:hypothetical protein DIPPA_30999 [Diplonema papillatum]
MAEADLGTLLAGFGAPPPLLTMDQEEEKARERREGSNGTGGRAPADEPCGGDAANGTAQEGGSPALNQPPELWAASLSAEDCLSFFSRTPTHEERQSLDYLPQVTPLSNVF